MSEQEIDLLEAGRELDIEIVERVMGYCVLSDKPVTMYRNERGIAVSKDNKIIIHPNNVPNYSTDIAAAWDVVEKCPHNMFYLERHDGVMQFWEAQFISTRKPSRANTAAHAICLAALAVVAVPPGEGQETTSPPSRPARPCWP